MNDMALKSPENVLFLRLILKISAFTAVGNRMEGRGVTFVNKRYTKGEPVKNWYIKGKGVDLGAGINIC